MTTEPKPLKPMHQMTNTERQVLISACQILSEFCNVPHVKQYLQAFVDGITALQVREERKEMAMKGKTND